MSEVPWSEAADLFADLLELPEEQRDPALTERTAGRPELRDAVERLLRAHASADTDFLDNVDAELARAVVEEAAGQPLLAGPYRLVQEIGRGGMGAVYLAERADGQFEQRVAVKMLKRGMDSEAILDRFLRERQILATLEHPNVARLLDGGIADDGRPFIVMEYVEGTTITEYSDVQQLTVDERLRLFQPVCDAVTYAHRNLVVHRDLKPSNILVTEEGVPKLLDFGIAKILGGAEGQGSATTELGSRLLTPEYAAPEQLTGWPVTTSTDVYGLGLVLYELLVGRRPFDRDSGSNVAMRSTAEPQLLASGRTLDLDEMQAIATARRTDPTRLERRLAGDLEIIVSKALRPQPDDRYASVEGLRDDLQRHQEQRPIQARRATFGYRVSRFARRHRGGVSAAAAVALVIIGFGVISTVQALRIRTQAIELAEERDRAQVEAATAAQVSDFMVGVFEVSDPYAAGAGDSITARELLDRGSARIQSELGTAPEVKARLLDVIAAAYSNLGLFDRADPVAVASLEARETAFGEGDPRVVESLRLLGQVRTRSEDFDGAEEALRSAIVILEPLGHDDPSMFAVRTELAGMFHRKGDHEAAGEVATELAANLPDFRSVPDGFPRDGLMELGTAFIYASDWDRSVLVFETLAALEREAGGSLSLPLSQALWGQAKAERGRGNPDAADSLLVLAMAIRDELSPNDVVTGNLLLEYSDFTREQGRWEAAEAAASAALAVYETQVGRNHMFTAQAEMAIARVAAERGDYELAAARYGDAIEIFRSAGTREASILLPVAVWRGGEALGKAGDYEAAEGQLREALASFQATYGDEYLFTVNVRGDLGKLLVEMGRGEDALPILESALAGLSKRWGEESLQADDVRIEIARACILTSRMDEAEAIVEEVLPRLEGERGAEDEYTVRARQVAQEIGVH